MLDRNKLQQALYAVLVAHSSQNGPSIKFVKQFEAAKLVLQNNPKAFSCFGMECTWQKQAS